MPDKPAYTVKPYPLQRRFIADTGRVQRKQHTIHALVEVDVTAARRLLHQEPDLSFTAFILACYGHAIAQNRYLNAYRTLWGRLLLFDDVDCTTMIEVQWGEQPFPLAHIIRGINRRDVRDISAEIQAVKHNPRTDAGFAQAWRYVPFLLLPAFLRDAVYRLLLRSPKLLKRGIGTTLLTSVGMFGSGSGWGLGPGTLYTTSIMVGGIAEKPTVVNGEIAIREKLSLTLSFNHDIVDGAPAARFVERLKNLIEAAHGLTAQP